MKFPHRLALASTLCALFAAQAHAQANLLSNAGAEAGDLSGWTAGGVSNPRVDSGSFDPGINPHGGAFDFLGGTGLDGSLTQNVSIAGAPNAAYASVSFWEQGLNQGPTSDDGYISLTFRSATNAVLGTVATPAVDSHDLAWQNYQGQYAIPTGTASIDYTMHFTRNVGSDLDTFIDDNSLSVSAVPEPAGTTLLALGLLALGIASRRKAGAARR